MSKNKLQKFAENEGFPNMFQPRFESLAREGFHLQGKWGTEFFRNDQPLVLELGCGKGEYTVGLAREDPANNYIGFDIKGARMWKGCKMSNELGLGNVAFVRTRVQNIGYFFDAGEVDEIWITFPDPQPRESKANKRLTSPAFLEEYGRVLKPGGIIHLKTDDDALYWYTLDVIRKAGHELLYASDDVYAENIDEPVTRIQTYYERMWLDAGKSIHYMRFRLNHDR